MLTCIHVLYVAVAAGMEVAMPQACANANLDTMVWIVKYCARIGSIAVALDDVMSHSRD